MITSLLFYFVFYALTVVVGSYAMTQYHAAASIAGLLSGIFVVGGFIGRLYAGNNVIRFGIKRMLYAGAIFYLLTTLLYFVMPNLTLLIILRFFHGIGFGIGATAASTLAGMIVPKSRRGEGIGYFALSITIASAFGPFISMSVYNSVGYQLLIVIASVAAVLALVLSIFIKVPEALAKARKMEKKPFSIWNFFEKSALPISLIGFLVGIGYASILSFLDSFSASIGLLTAGSLFYVIYAIFIVGSRPLSGRLFDAKGDNFVMYPTFIFFAFGLALTGLSNSTLLLLTAAAFVGLGYGSFLPFGQAIAIRNAEPERIGIATSTIYGIFDMGVGVGPFLLGTIIPMTGYRKLYYLSAVFLLVVAVIYYFVHGRKALKPIDEYEVK